MSGAALDCSTPAGLADQFGHAWQGRRVAIVGLGKSGLAAAELLCRAGARVRATDVRARSELAAIEASLRGFGVETIEVGGHTQPFMEGCELVIVSPGVPESAAPIQWALARQVPVLSEIELAYRFCRAPIIAVTGTNGKSTAVSVMAEVLQASGREAIPCGNLGTPFSSVIDRLTPQHYAVVEVSSFQLLRCEAFRPRIAMLLNIGTNHLDRHQDRAAYLAAKSRLFQRQTPDDWALLNARDPEVVSLAPRLHARIVWFGENRANPPAMQLAAQTRRALTEGAQAILQAARLLGVPDPLAWQVIRAFRGLEHRLEHVATRRGIHFVNDSKSTTPESLLFALGQTRGSVVVMVGGRDKGLDFSPLAQALHQERIKGVVLLGESRRRLRAVLNGSPGIVECESLEAAVSTATSLAEPGTTVLFSPACASFDMFRNFEERGRAFKAIVRALPDAPSSNGKRAP